VPFTIPGDSEPCDTLKDPREEKDRPIPDFLQTLEKPDLAHPGQSLTFGWRTSRRLRSTLCSAPYP
jgi:hypothetical protein